MEPQATPTARIFRGAGLATAVVAPAAVAVAAATSGVAGVIGAVMGVAVVVLFFSLSFLVITRVSGMSVLPAALAMYMGKMLVLAILFITLRNATWLSHAAFGYTVLAATIVWLTAQVQFFRTAKLLYAEPEPGPQAGAR